MSQFPAPIPRPQARTTDTYVRPNPLQPQQPVAFAPGYAQGRIVRNDLGDAVQRLAGVLGQVGPSLVATEAQRVQDLEAIRLSRMETDEIRADLMSQARAMEKAGTLQAGSNPYRLMAIQETLADRMMREDFNNVLDANLSKFSQPDNPEDPAEFALETYQRLQIPGVFGQRRAAAMYSEKSSTWLAQVNQQKNAKIVVKNDEDYSDDLYSLFGTYLDEPGAMDQAGFLQAILSRSDEFYNLTGQSGRDQIVGALGVFIKARGNSAANDGDESELERLIAVVEQVEEGGVGGLGFGNNYEANFEELRTELDALMEESKDESLRNRPREQADAAGVANRQLLNHLESGKPIDTSPTGDFALMIREDLVKMGISQEVIDAQILALPTLVNQYLSATSKPSPEAIDGLEARLLQARSSEEIKAITDEYLANGLVPPQYLAAAVDRATQRVTQLSIEARLTRIGLQENDAVIRANLLAAEAGGGNAEDPTLVGPIIVEMGELNKSRIEESLTLPEEDREAFVKQELAEFADILKYDQESGNTFYDLNKMVELGFSPESVEAAREINTSAATFTEAGEVMAVAGPDQLSIDYSGYFDKGYRPFIRLADDISETLMGTPRTRSGTDLETMRDLGTQIYTDAGEYRKLQGKKQVLPDGTVVEGGSGLEIRSDGLYGKVSGTRLPESAQYSYLSAVRLSGLTPEELRQGQTAEGLKLSQSVALTDPGLTVMSAPETFIQDLERLATVNTEDMTEMELREALSDTSLMQGYLAYQANQKSQGVSFDQFVLAQIQIMPYAGAPASSELITRLANPPKSTPNIPEDARPAGQENS